MLTRKPKSTSRETKADRFIHAGAIENGKPTPRDLQPVIINFDRNLLDRIDRRAKSMGLNRTAFVVNAAAEKLLALGSE